MADNDSKPYGVIYCVTNSVNGKRYVGQTIQTLNARWRLHKTSGACRLLRRAIDKYGESSFDICVLEPANSKTELDLAEIEWIFKMNTLDPSVGYNLKDGGSSRRYSIASKQKMSDSAKSRLSSEESRSELSARRKAQCNADGQREKMAHFEGHEHSAESKLRISDTLKKTFSSTEMREKLSNSKKLLWQSEEYRLKVTAARRGLKHSQETIEKMRSVKTAYWAAKKAAKT